MIGAAHIETPKLYGYQGERYSEWNRESWISIKIIVQDEKVPVINIYNFGYIVYAQEQFLARNGELGRLGGILKTQIYWSKLKKVPDYLTAISVPNTWSR